MNSLFSANKISASLIRAKFENGVVSNPLDLDVSYIDQLIRTMSYPNFGAFSHSHSQDSHCYLHSVNKKICYLSETQTLLLNRLVQ